MCKSINDSSLRIANKFGHRLNLSGSLGEPFLIEFIVILFSSDTILLKVFYICGGQTKITLILACSRSTLSFVKLYWLKGGEPRNRIQKHFGNLFGVSFPKSDNFVSAERGPKCKESKSCVKFTRYGIFAKKEKGNKKMEKLQHDAGQKRGISQTEFIYGFKLYHSLPVFYTSCLHLDPNNC